MEVDWGIAVAVAMPLITLFAGAFLNRAIESRPRLVTYLGHVSAHTVPRIGEEPLIINTHSIVLRNAGRRPATNIRLNHPLLPNFTVFPDMQHHVDELPGGGREIVFPTLAPGEQVTVSYLYFPPITWEQINGPVRSDEGLAKVLLVLPTQQYPKWFNRLVFTLMLIGLVSVIYVVIVIILHYLS
jgi:hypothetical protein